MPDVKPGRTTNFYATVPQGLHPFVWTTHCSHFSCGDQKFCPSNWVCPVVCTTHSTLCNLDCLQSVSLSFLYQNNTLLDMKLGREWWEGLGRVETVAREKRNGLQTLLFCLGTSSGVKTGNCQKFSSDDGNELLQSSSLSLTGFNIQASMTKIVTLESRESPQWKQAGACRPLRNVANLIYSCK